MSRPPGGRRRSAHEVACRLAAVREMVAAGTSRAAIVRECRVNFGASERAVDADLARLRAETGEQTEVDTVRVELLDLAARVAAVDETVAYAGRALRGSNTGAVLDHLADDLGRLGELASLQLAATTDGERRA
jgi:hypothetical protein